MFRRFSSLLMIVFPSLGVLYFVLYGVSRRGWSLWGSLAILVGFAALITIIVLSRRLLQLRRENKSSVRKIGRQRSAARTPAHDPSQFRDLLRKWEQAIQRLAQTPLTRKGNPIYAFPWFILVGESGSGKTTALEVVQLSRFPTDGAPRDGGGTADCDWYFFDQGIFLDTTGRYAFSVGNRAKDDAEWEYLLSLLHRNRRKEPLNGLVIAISTEKLLQLGEKEIRERGKLIRNRIEQLMKISRFRFPVYVLVTKLDLVMGMLDFGEHVPPQAFAQPMGFISKDPDETWEKVLGWAYKAIAEKLKDLRLLVLSQTRDVKLGVHLFATEFENLKSALTNFVDEIFAPSPYQETPMFRGLFFSSGAQSPRATAPRTGTFLLDFFKNVLPADRNVGRPLLDFFRWQRITKSLEYIAWAALWVTLCLLLTYSFFKNKTVNRPPVNDAAYQERYFSRTLSGSDLVILKKFQSEIDRVERKNKGWGLVRLGLGQSLHFERELKSQYVDRLERFALDPLDQSIKIKLEEKGADAFLSDEARANNVIFYMVRMMLHSRPSDPHVLANFRVISSEVLRARNIRDQEAESFAGLYQSYLLWRDPAAYNPFEDFALQIELEWFCQKPEALDWLTGYLVGRSLGVELADFWGKRQGAPYPSDIAVPRAYTDEGFNRIEDFLGQLLESIDDASIKIRIQTLRKQYHLQYVRTWDRFMAGFYQEGCPQTAADMRRIAKQMITENNPYFRFLDTLALEMSGIAHDQRKPAWIDQAIALWNIREQVRKTEKTAKSGQKESLLNKIMPGGVTESLALQKQSQAWQDYVTVLKEKFASLDKASTNIIDLIISDINGGGESFGTCEERFEAAKGAAQGSTNVWKIAHAPLQYLLYYGMLEAGLKLQTNWSAKVAIKTTPEEIGEAVENFLGKDDVTAFIEDDSIYGWKARNLQGEKVPFNGAFWSFINKKEWQSSSASGSGNGGGSGLSQPQSYEVTLATRPMKVNDDARVKPTVYVFELQIQGGDSKRLTGEPWTTNKKAFLWEPNAGGDVLLTIKLHSTATGSPLELRKYYRGQYAFRNFLLDFQNGKKTFRASDFASDFPKQAATLEGWNVQWIEIAYDISGQNYEAMHHQDAWGGSGPGKKDEISVPQQIINLGAFR